MLQSVVMTPLLLSTSAAFKVHLEFSKTAWREEGEGKKEVPRITTARAKPMGLVKV